MSKLKYIKNDFGNKTMGFKSHYSLNEFVSQKENTFKFNYELNENRTQNLPLYIEARVKTFYNHLINFLNKHDFYPHLIETSLYKPESLKNLAQFYVTVFCPNKGNLEKYIEGIKTNIDDLQGKDGFGPIIHNQNLGLSPYYFKEIDPFICEPLEQSNLNHYCYGQYAYEDRSGKGFVAFDTLSSKIDGFFKATTTDFKNKKYSTKSSIELNSALLIPLPKPSASFFAGGSQNYKGGGIFLFGELKNKSEENQLQFILKLRQFVIASVFDMTYSSIEMEEMEDSKNFFQLGVIHHFKNTLRVDIVEPVDSILKMEIPEEAKLKLYNIKDATGNTVKHTSNLVEAVKLLKSRKDFKHINGKDLERLLNNACRSLVSNSIDFVFQNNVIDSFGFIASPTILKMILEELIQNAVKEYHRMEEAQKDLAGFKFASKVSGAAKTKKIEFEFVEIHNQVELSVQSYDTEIDSEALKQAGSDPISNRKSGIGLYTINKYLENLNATRVEKLKYFKIENNKTPKGVKVSFSFQKSTKI